MKKILLILFVAIMTNMSFAATISDTLSICFNRIQATDTILQTFMNENNVLKNKMSSLNSTISTQAREIDSLKSILTGTNNSVAALADSLNSKIFSTREQIQTYSDNLNQNIERKSKTNMWIFITLVLVIVAIAFVFGKSLAKRSNEVASLSAKADKLNEEIVNRLSSEMSELQSISKRIGSIVKVSDGGTDTEQKLITTLADRITFMEMTLSKMDSSVRGHKQLSNSIKQMKDNLLANGYELVDMLGKGYHDGMKVTANFVVDKNLSEGQQIITGIIKPQINYQGKMIQSAQITVSQNI